VLDTKEFAVVDSSLVGRTSIVWIKGRGPVRFVVAEGGDLVEAPACPPAPPVEHQVVWSGAMRTDLMPARPQTEDERVRWQTYTDPMEGLTWDDIVAAVDRYAKSVQEEIDARRRREFKEIAA
jgi:hypothetical protein